MPDSQLRSTWFAPRTPTNYKDRDVIAEGYTPPFLTLPQHAAVLVGSSLASALLHQPIRQLSTLSFLMAVPGDRTQVVVISDKRAMFFYNIFSTQWFGSIRTVSAAWFNYASVVGIYAVCHANLKESLGNTASGFASGAVVGLSQSLVRHPYDVLRATAQHPLAPKNFSGPLDVLMTSIRHKPSNLLDLYRGGSIITISTTAQYALLLGWYNYVKEDRVARGLHHLFFAIHVMACATTLIAYPFLNLRQMAHISNLQLGGVMKMKKSDGTFMCPKVTMTQLFWELKKKHGITKVYEGYFRNRPFLAIAPLSLMITLYDLGCRRYTEFIHPSMKRSHAEPSQYLLRPKTPDYVLERSRKVDEQRAKKSMN
jgi:hypothetical protein